MTRPRRDYRTTASGPERAAQGRRARQGDDRTGAIAWFNCRQRHAVGEQPGAMADALAKAGLLANRRDSATRPDAPSLQDNARTTP